MTDKQDFEDDRTTTGLPATGGNSAASDSLAQSLAAAEQLAGTTMAVMTNFVGEGVDLWRFTQMVQGPDVMPSDKFPLDGVTLKYVYCHGVEVTSREGGEVIDAVRTVLVDTNDKAYGFVSDGIFKSAIGLMRAYKFGAITPALKVKVASIKTRNRNTMLMLVPAV